MENLLMESYQRCIDEFVLRMSGQFQNDIIAVILQGGIMRDGTPIKRWSDIDLIVISKAYNPLLTQFLGKVSNKLNSKYGLRMDFKLVYKSDIKNSFRRSKYCSSEIMNAINGRSAKVIFGSLDSIFIDGFDEREAVYVYLNVTLLIFRQYYIDDIYTVFDISRCEAYLQRILREETYIDSKY